MPTRTIRKGTSALVAMCAAVLAGCNSDPNERAPIPTAPSPPFMGRYAVSVSGVVFEATTSGLRVLAGVGIDIGPEYSSQLPHVMSTADGRYEVMTESSSPILKVVGAKTGYSQPCRVTVPSGGNVRNLYLVSNETLATTGVPVSMPLVPQTVSGVVLERTITGDRPIAGASVTADFSNRDGWGPSASTVSDAQGRYLLCGIGPPEPGLTVNLFVAKPGFQSMFVSVDPPAGGSIDLNRGGTLDVELRRE